MDNTHQQDPMHTQTPEDIRALAGRLGRLGEQERAAGEDPSLRVAMRTSNLLRAAPGAVPAPPARLRSVWLWLAAPVTATAAVLTAIALFMFQPAAQLPADPGAGVEVLAAGLESDLDAFLNIEAVWEGDGYETGLAAVSLNAAGLANQERDDTLTSLGSDS